jgi:DNA-binding transcriptional LysR family regulator
MIKQLHRMAVFAQVVECGSFSKAAIALGLGKSVVSSHITTLEKKLGAQLITRSTRALELTQEGQVFYEGCRQMVAAGEQAFAIVDSQRAVVSGSIRLTSSYNFGVSFLIPQLTAFLKLYPAVTFDLVLEDTVSHVIEERFDLALRVGHLPDTGLFATKLGNCKMLLCASPALLAEYAPMRQPVDVLQLPWVAITQLAHPEKLFLVHKSSKQRISLDVRQSVKTRSGMAAREFIRAGAGVGILPDFAVFADLASGHLIQILPDWQEANERPVSAIFPNRDRRPVRVTLLIEFLLRSFSDMRPVEGVGDTNAMVGEVVKTTRRRKTL